MSGGWLILFETLVVLGLVFGFGLWELRSLKRLKAEREAKEREAREKEQAATKDEAADNIKA